MYYIIPRIFTGDSSIVVQTVTCFYWGNSTECHMFLLGKQYSVSRVFTGESEQSVTCFYWGISTECHVVLLGNQYIVSLFFTGESVQSVMCFYWGNSTE